MSRRSNSKVMAACQAAANNAYNNAALSGFRRLQSGPTLTSNFSSSTSFNELATDLAARQIEHCLEAWSYASQSLFALLSGNQNIAIHLAYYSEVRSANSLFASTGIAIKEHPNYYIGSSGQRRRLEAPTHKAIRKIWPDWCKRADAQEAFESLKVAPSISMGDISSSMGLSNSHQNSLLKWGYELIHFSGDHLSRNNASYNAYKIYDQIPPLDTQEHGEFVALIWEHLVSTGVSGQYRFEQLYAQYVIFCYCFDYARENEEHPDDEAFQAKYDEIIFSLNKTTGISEVTLRAVLYIEQKNDERFSLFELASSPAVDAQNIIARAFILVRLATNKLNSNLVQARCTNGFEWIATWLTEVGVIGEETTVEDVCGAAEDYLSSALNVSKVPMRELWKIRSQEAATACRLDKSLCWGIEL